MMRPVTPPTPGSNPDTVRKDLAAVVREAYRMHPLPGFEDRFRILEHCLAETADISGVADIISRWAEQLAASFDFPRPVPDSKKSLQMRIRTAKRSFDAAFDRTRRITF